MVVFGVFESTLALEMTAGKKGSAAEKDNFETGRTAGFWINQTVPDAARYRKS